MSLNQHIQGIILSIMQHEDDALRKSATHQLAVQCQNDPNQIIEGLLWTLRFSCLQEHQKFSAIHLRLFLSSETTIPSIWEKLTPDSKEKVINQFFFVLSNLMNTDTMKPVTKTIGQIISFLASKNAQDLYLFMKLVWKLFEIKDGSGQYAYYAFLILENAFNSPSNLQDFFKTIRFPQHLLKSLMGGADYIKVAALRCFRSFLKYMKNMKLDQYQHLVPSILENVGTLFFQYENREGLELLSQMLSTRPFFFNNQFNELIHLLISIAKLQRLEMMDLRLTLQTIFDYMTLNQKKFVKQDRFIEEIVQIVFNYMNKFCTQMDLDWNDGECFYRNIIDNAQMKILLFGIGCIDKLIRFVPLKKWKKRISQIINQWSESNDERHQYMQLLTLSLVNKYIHFYDRKQRGNIFLKSLSSSSQKIRFFGLIAINILLSGMDLDQRNDFSLLLVNDLLTLIERNSSPLEVNRAINIFSYFSFKETSLCVDIMMNFIKLHLQNGVILVKQAVISTLVTLNTSNKDLFFDQTMTILINYRFNPPHHTALNKKMDMKVGLALKNMLSIGGKQRFKPYLESVVSIISFLQQTELTQAYPCMNEIYGIWTKLIEQYYQELKAIIPDFPFAFIHRIEKFIALEIDLLRKMKEDANYSEMEVKSITSIDEEKPQLPQISEMKNTQGVLSFFYSLIEVSKNEYQPLLSATIKMLSYIYSNNHPSLQVQSKLKDCYLLMLTKLYQVFLNRKEFALMLTDETLQTIKKLMKKRSEKVMQKALEDLNTLILNEFHFQYLRKYQIRKIQQMTKELSIQCCETYSTIRKNIQSSIDEDQKGFLLEHMQQVGETQLLVAVIIKSLFIVRKTQPIEFLDILNYQFENVIVQNMKPYKESLVGCFLIQALLKYGGTHFIKKYSSSLMISISTYLKSPKCSIRQLAVQCMLMAIKTARVLISPENEKFVLDKMKKATSTPISYFDQNEENLQKNYIDYISMGMQVFFKLLKQCSGYIDLIIYLSVWTQNIQLIKSNKGKCGQQIERIIEVMRKRVETRRPESFVMIAKILTSLLRNQSLLTKTACKNIRIYMNDFYQDPIFRYNRRIVEFKVGESFEIIRKFFMK